MLIKNKQRYKLNLKIFFHIVIWAIILLGLFLINNSKESNSAKLITEGINVCFYALLVYVNYIFLIPKFLSQKKYVKYLVSLGVLVLFVTPLKIIAIYYRLDDFKELQLGLLNQKVVFFVSSLLVVLISTLIKVISDWFKHQNKVKNLERQKLESEIRFLKSQINPHFLFNTLNSLYALTLKKSDDAPKTVLQLSEMMRYMLYECNERNVPLSKEIAYISNYIELEKKRYSNKIEINLNVDNVDQNILISPLIFIAFIENSFKHGIRNQIGAAYIDIRFTKNDDILVFECLNSKGQLISDLSNATNSGVGLKNVYRRLELLYPDKHKLEIIDNEEVYNVKLEIKLN